MIHRDIESLAPSFRDAARVAIQAMQDDPDIRAAGFRIIILETLREIAVQMAYAVRARIRARPEDGCTDLAWVVRFFRAAGLSWAPTATENMSPSTWTLASRHLEGLAFDAAPSKDDFNPDWNAPDWVWERMAQIAEAHGLAAGRHFPDRKQDSPHFEAKVGS